MFDVNEIAVVVSAFLAVAVRSVWYSSALFGTLWSRAEGHSEVGVSDTRSYLIGDFLVRLIMIYVMSQFLLLGGGSGMLHVLTVAGLLSLLLALSRIGDLLHGKSGFTLFFINAGYDAVVMIGAACVVSYWPW